MKKYPVKKVVGMNSQARGNLLEIKQGITILKAKIAEMTKPIVPGYI